MHHEEGLRLLVNQQVMQGRRDLSAAPHQTHLLCSLTALGGSLSSEGSETSVSKHRKITAGGGGGGACGGGQRLNHGVTFLCSAIQIS